MNGYKVFELEAGKAFTEDAYIIDNMFFLPKNVSIQPFHLKILEEWNIDKILSEGKPTEGISLKEIYVVKSDSNDDKTDATKQNDENQPKTEPSIFVKSHNDSTVKMTTAVFEDIYLSWITEVEALMSSLITTGNIDKNRVVTLIQAIINTVGKNRNYALMMIGKPFEKINSVYKRSVETTILSYIIAKSINLNELNMQNLMIATLFHDIGMLKIPKEILAKKSSLTNEELTVIKGHTLIGFKYLRNVKYSPIIASGALQHHERVDGEGYPSSLQADKVTLIAKIIAVVDAYCAAISNKPFKNSMHGKEALQDLLKGGGSAYDSSILKELIKNISFYPIGSLVILSDSQIARVVGTSGVAMRPIVSLVEVKGIEGVIDLSKRNDLYIKGVHLQ